MPNYGLDTGDGDQVTTGLPAATARATAQRMANERGETLYLYALAEGDGEPGESVAIVPEVEVRDYETGDVLPGTADALLVRASRRAGPVGAVSAYSTREMVVDQGLVTVWYHCAPGREDDMRRVGRDVRTVYVAAV